MNRKGNSNGSYGYEKYSTPLVIKKNAKQNEITLDW